MGVQLNIKDPETVRLARELAGQTGRSVTETIRLALERAMADRESDVEHRKRELNAVFDKLREHRPAAWDGRTSKELMDELYDDDGLPI